MRQTVAHLFIARTSNNQRPKILHPSGLGLLLALIVFINSSVKLVTLVGGNILGFATNIQVDRIVELTNLERAKLGLNTLILNPQLTQAALAKATDMFSHDYWAHVALDGKQPWDFIIENGYVYRYAGENLARDFNDSDNVIKAWMASATHRDNIINPNYQDLGLAVVNGKLDGVETTLVVQMFGQEEKPALGSKAQDESIIPPAQAAGIGTLPPASTIADREAAQPTSKLPTQLQQTQLSSPVGQSFISPFLLEKNIFLTLFAVLMFILLLDLYLVKKKQLVRLTGKNWSHLMFFTAIVVLILSLLPGSVL